ncbi:MAG: outer membrane beta-barrel protein [Pseudomonadota bacterium]
MKKIVAASVAVLGLTTVSGFAADDLVIEAPELSVSEEKSGAYIAARISGAFTDDTAFGLSVVATDIVNGYDDPGIAGSLAVGYRFNNSFAAELEVGAGEQDIDAHTLTAIDTTLSGDNAFGTTKFTYGLINGSLMVDTGTIFTPYVSAGLGIADVEFENHGVELAAAVGPLGPGSVTAMDDSDTAFAYQIGFGSLIDVTDKIGLELGYRYFSVSDVELTAVDGTETDVDLDQHQLSFGIRYSF